MKSNLRQPGNTTNISDDYPTHLSRGSLGGDDLTDPYGTPVHAQLNNARVTIVDNSPDGSGGRYSRVTGPDGDAVESLHQSSVTAGRGQAVNENDVIGRSGASAYGSDWGTGGPHIHNHGVHANGVRFNLEPYYWWLNGGLSPAAGNITSIGEDELTPDDKKWLEGQFALITAQYNNEISGIKGILAQTDEIEGAGSGPYTTVQSKLDLLLAWVGGSVHGENRATSIRQLVTQIAKKLGA